MGALYSEEVRRQVEIAMNRWRLKWKLSEGDSQQLQLLRWALWVLLASMAGIVLILRLGLSD